jgi:hypothetical protein
VQLYSAHARLDPVPVGDEPDARSTQAERAEEAALILFRENLNAPGQPRDEEMEIDRITSLSPIE